MLLNSKSEVLSRCAFIVLFCFSFVQYSCDSSNDVIKSDEKSVEGFMVENYKVVVNEGARTIVITVPQSTNVTNLSPAIVVSLNATISPESGIAQDFSKPVVYTVMAENGTSQTYLVSVDRLYGLEKFALKISGEEYAGEIDHDKKEIAVAFDFEHVKKLLAFTVLTTKIQVGAGFSISPATDAPVDLASPANQVLHDSNGGADISYKVIIRNTNNALLGVSITLGAEYGGLLFGRITGQVYPDDVVGLPADGFVLRVLPTDDISALVPKFNLSERSSVSPAVNTPQNFNQDVTYTITSETGVSRAYVIRIVKRSFIVESDDSPMSINNANEITIQVGYRTISNVVTAKLINTKASTEMACTFSSSDYVYKGEAIHQLTLFPASTLPSGTYNLYVELANGEKITSRAKFRKD